MIDLVLANADFYCGDRVVTDRALRIRGDRIGSFVPLEDAAQHGEVIDLKGASVSPGFIDLQVNGGGGVLWNDVPTAEAARTIWRAHLRTGTTNLFPTFITGPLDGMKQAAAAVRDLIKSGDTGILGIHFEGPWIEASKAGVHDRIYIREPDDGEEQVYLSLLPIPTLVTLAPELVSPETLTRLSSKGVRVSAGHTNATYSQMLVAMRAGLGGVTHLHNAMSPLTSREPGVVGAALAEEALKTGIIVDGHHVHFATVRASWKAKKRGDLFLVTDAMPPVGGGADHFRIGGHEIVYRDGRCQTRDGVLGGSAIDLASAIRNSIQKVGIPKDEALRMATLYPARFLGLDREYGQIKEGFVANLTIFNNEIGVMKVMFKGTFLDDRSSPGAAA